MKKVFLSLLIVSFMATTAFAVDFTPSLLKLSAPQAIQYGFDGTELRIPVTVSGAPASTIFLVYTKGQGDAIGTVQNGHLGWHYVNNIDTCMYVSGANDLDVGASEIIWDGKDSDGGTIPAGDYTYYLFAYDNKTPKQLATNIYSIGYSYHNTLEVTDVDGLPLAKPIMYMHGNKKWVVGSDPEDQTLIETTLFRSGFARGTHIALDPEDHSQVYVQEGNSTDLEMFLVKYSWVPNGEATIMTEWAEEGISDLGSVANYYFVLTGAYSDGETIWCSTALPLAGKGEGVSEVFYVNLDEGTVDYSLDLGDWYLSIDDADNNGQYHGGPDGMFFRNNILFTQSLEGCMTMAFDPYKEDDDEKILWGTITVITPMIITLKKQLQIHGCVMTL